MLMMLVGVGGLRQSQPTDAHDAGGRWGLAKEPAQLMLTMLVGVGGLRQLMRMTLAGRRFGEQSAQFIGKSQKNPNPLS